MSTSIIELDVGLTAKTKAEIDEYYAKVDEIKQTLLELKEIEEPEDKSSVAKLKKSKTDDEEDVSLIKLDPRIQKFFTNPEKFIQDQIKDKIGKQFEDVLESLPVIAIAILAVKVAEKVLELMVQKGGPLNRDFRRIIEEEVDVGLSRELVKQRELGEFQTILSQIRGFVPHNENWTYNSLMYINETRIARIGLDDRAFGVVAR